MFKRHKQEKEEGKTYNDPGVCTSVCYEVHCLTLDFKVSAEMKALNRQFGSLHGISSLFNLFAVIALGLHGLWIGNAGL